MELLRKYPQMVNNSYQIFNKNRFPGDNPYGDRGSGEICINGAAARLATKDDIVIILSYHAVPEDEASDSSPKLVYVDKENRITETKNVNDWTTDLISAR